MQAFFLQCISAAVLRMKEPSKVGSVDVRWGMFCLQLCVRMYEHTILLQL